MCVSSYYELRQCRPRTGKLRWLLAECPYRGPEYEDEGPDIEAGGCDAGEGGDRENWDGEKRAKRRKICSEQPRKV